MKLNGAPLGGGFARRPRGYLLVLFAVILAFVAVATSMQVLILTSVATTARAYDTYRQSLVEVTRVERAVVETMLDQRQSSVRSATESDRVTLGRHLAEVTGTGSRVTVTQIPDALPAISCFPSDAPQATLLTPVPPDLQPFLGPEFLTIIGPRVASSPELLFQFESRRTIGESQRSYGIQVRTRLLAVPLTRFPVAAYDLPGEIGENTAFSGAVPPSTLPAGIVPGRDSAFVRDLQAQPGTLPYHYRRRATLSAAYQYVFSQQFIDRAAEYAGITHFCDLDAVTGTAVLAGMVKTPDTSDWDIAVAGDGTFDTTTLVRDAAIVYTETTGHVLRLHDSAGESTRAPLVLLLLGPSDANRGPLVVDLTTLARPVIIIGYHIQITASVAVTVNGALLLDPTSTAATDATLTVGHLSYWSGAAIPRDAIRATGVMPLLLENMAPRVVYVATIASRL